MAGYSQKLTFGGHKRTPETVLSALKMRMMLDTLQQPTFGGHNVTKHLK
jgi:hypothetical protein